MTYLERYCSGAYQTVWDELVALGSDVRVEPIYADACAVAQETMRRVRQNIEILVSRLSHSEFIFGYNHLQQRFFKQVTGAFSDGEKRSYYDFFCWMRRQPPVMFPTFVAQDILPYRGQIEGTRPSTPELLDQLEQECGSLPIAVRAWYTEVGTVNFYGYCPVWNTFVETSAPRWMPWNVPFQPIDIMSACDPLQVAIFDAQTLEDIRISKHQRKSTLALLEFAPDHDFKNYSGGTSSPYVIQLPDACADACGYYLFDGSTTFVHYLRVSLLQWAGFPGMAGWSVRPVKDLAMLTEGLIPF